MEMEVGRIEKWLTDAGYGFISAERGRDVFLHLNAVVSGTPYVGATVRFIRIDCPKGPFAAKAEVE